MIKKEITCFECGYCGAKFDNEDKCLRHEAMHAEEFNSEKNLFDKFVTELSEVTVNTNAKETITNEETGEVTENVPVVYCSKCMRPIAEDQDYVSAFGYTLCLDCAIPMLKSFAKNYGNFKAQFLTYMNTTNPYFSRFVVDDKGNITEDRCKGLIIRNPDNCCCGSKNTADTATVNHIH